MHSHTHWIAKINNSRRIFNRDLQQAKELLKNYGIVGGIHEKCSIGGRQIILEVPPEYFQPSIRLLHISHYTSKITASCLKTKLGDFEGNLELLDIKPFIPKVPEERCEELNTIIQKYQVKEQFLQSSLQYLSVLDRDLVSLTTFQPRPSDDFAFTPDCCFHSLRKGTIDNLLKNKDLRCPSCGKRQEFRSFTPNPYTTQFSLLYNINEQINRSSLPQLADLTEAIDKGELSQKVEEYLKNYYGLSLRDMPPTPSDWSEKITKILDECKQRRRNIIID